MLTVALCTWNRARLLRRALASHAALRVPAGVAWELVVVDNGSTDDTPRVLDEFADRLPLRRVAEPRPGLSHARNAAVAAARGRVVVWTDDDTLVDRDWLAAYADAFARRPAAAVFGGPVLPHFDPEPPPWLRRALPHVANAYALLDYGPEPVRFEGECLPFGANYAVRADAQRRHAYSPRLGRTRGNMGAGEETAVVRAILAAGGAGWWVPAARVAHLIPAERQTVRYLRAYYYGNGASVSYDEPPPERLLFGRPRWLWRQAVGNEVLYRLTRPLAGPERWAQHLRKASSAWGKLSVRAVPSRSASSRAP